MEYLCCKTSIINEHPNERIFMSETGSGHHDHKWAVVWCHDQSRKFPCEIGKTVQCLFPVLHHHIIDIPVLCHFFFLFCFLCPDDDDDQNDTINSFYFQVYVGSISATNFKLIAAMMVHTCL